MITSPDLRLDCPWLHEVCSYALLGDVGSFAFGGALCMPSLFIYILQSRLFVVCRTVNLLACLLHCCLTARLSKVQI